MFFPRFWTDISYECVLCFINISLRSKRSRTKRMKFGPRKGVIRAAREKWGQSKTPHFSRVPNAKN